MKTHYTIWMILSLLLTPIAWAQDEADQPTSEAVEVSETNTEDAAKEDAAASSATPAATDEPQPTFADVSQTVKQQLEEAVAELTALREQIADEKIPLNAKLADLESELIEVRQQFQKTTRKLDNRNLELTNLRNSNKAREEESRYLSNLLTEYLRNLEPRIHISELQRYEAQLEEARLAPENQNLDQGQVFAKQLGMVTASVDRLFDLMGGARFEGSAIDKEGTSFNGAFVIAGPVAIFRSTDGKLVGTVDSKLNSLKANVTPFKDPATAEAAATLVADGKGYLPFDSTLGNAHAIEETKDTFLEHVQKGGPVMVPIFVLAGLALLVALYKWLALSLIRNPSRRRLQTLLDAVAQRDKTDAMAAARQVNGPAGKMLESGVEHIEEPRELVEEIMYEHVLQTRLKVNRFLPFISICAASAPLLGLLGTVTGIINTFEMITIFGTGDAESLSGGISEALITTKFGLIVAIPSLLLYAFLSRKARGVIDGMEKSAVALVNQMGKTPFKPLNEAA